MTITEQVGYAAPCSTSAIQRLRNFYAAILARAIQDACLPDPKDKDRANGLEFLFSDEMGQDGTVSFLEICQILDLNPKGVRKSIRKILSEGKTLYISKPGLNKD